MSQLLAVDRCVALYCVEFADDNKDDVIVEFDVVRQRRRRATRRCRGRNELRRPGRRDCGITVWFRTKLRPISAVRSHAVRDEYVCAEQTSLTTDVRLSVCHTSVFQRNSWTHRQTFCHLL